jgi:uncharacterized domain 1
MENIKAFFLNDRFAVHAGIELLEVSPGWAMAKLEINESHLNAGNVIQGGALFTLADLTFAAAVNAYGNLAVSVESSIRYFKGVSEGTLFAVAEPVHLHKKLATFEVKITNRKEELIALFTATAYRKDIRLPFDTETV